MILRRRHRHHRRRSYLNGVNSKLHKRCNPFWSVNPINIVFMVVISSSKIVGPREHFWTRIFPTVSLAWMPFGPWECVSAQQASDITTMGLAKNKHPTTTTTTSESAPTISTRAPLSKSVSCNIGEEY
mmetsp:Transcript_15683/g.17579  ORF Transcript_15683/g.17579 Transcript_15683/m.17579 type:complete len:128 (+) Transcript_15683:836-1219(+)